MRGHRGCLVWYLAQRMKIGLVVAAAAAAAVVGLMSTKAAGVFQVGFGQPVPELEMAFAGRMWRADSAP